MMKLCLYPAVYLLCCFSAVAQFDVPLNKISKLLDNGLSKKIKHEPITTSFTDCNINTVMPESFGANEVKKQLCDQPYEAGKGYKLQSGFYKGSIMSFCLKAGTYSPSKGDGYLFAKLKGPKEEMVFKLINNWYNHKEIDQHDLQLLLWAIISKTKFKDLSPRLKAIATVLLSDNDMKQLSKVGLDIVSNELMKKAILNLPEPVQRIAELENQMRSKFTQATISYQEIESLAILPGTSSEKSIIERGLWTLLPNGCYIKYLPQGYSITDIEFYVPSTITINVYYFGCGQIATPANTGSQRLAQSNNIICTKE